MIVFYILRQAQSKISILTFINLKVFVYVFIDKVFAQYHYFFLFFFIYLRRFQNFNDQVNLIEDIIHITEIIMTLINHIERLFLYVINLNQYFIIKSFF